MKFESIKQKKPAFAGWFLTILMFVVPIAGFAQVTQNPGQAVDPLIAQKLIDAYRYHELAVLCVKKGEFELAMTTARQIIQLHLPPEYQDRVVESLAIITEKLAEARRFDLGHQLLDEALSAGKPDAHRVKLLLTKARLYHLAGNDDKAVETVRKAMDLQARIGG
jgi:tetratricopeptide (TPR) repeat protein